MTQQINNTGFEEILINEETHFILYSEGRKVLSLSPESDSLDLVSQGADIGMKLDSDICIMSLFRFIQSKLMSKGIPVGIDGVSECDEHSAFNALMDIETQRQKQKSGSDKSLFGGQIKLRAKNLNDAQDACSKICDTLINPLGSQAIAVYA